MGYTTKIDWCDTSWNPVTGCRHGCKYCYARGIANRFGGYSLGAHATHANYVFNDGNYELDEYLLKLGCMDKLRSAPYPFKFEPTFHRYRLDQPKKWTEPRTIFVCSMADLFGEWVPLKWIQEVFEACKAAPQHRYLFLTKNPARYFGLAEMGLLPKDKNFWYGTTTTTQKEDFFWSDEHNTFLSIEPIHGPFEKMEIGTLRRFTNWIIVGAETGSRKDKIIPEKAWIDELVACAWENEVPIFMKESLKDMMGMEFKQQFPWEV